MYKIFITLFLLPNSHAFYFNKPIYFNRNQLLKSHFSSVSTQLKDKDLLIQSLYDINENFNILDEPTMVRGYNNVEVLADVVIRQETGIDIGFTLNGDVYEMVTDLQFWNQSVPVEVFLERLAMKYSYNSIISSCKEEGYVTNYIKNNQEDGTIEIEISRYDFSEY